MRIRVLGCSGGIGGRHLRTTSLLVDTDILIDAGTGVVDLSQAELAAIDHVFLTHSHLDHIACLPLMVDAIADMRNTPMTVYAPRATLETLHAHIFNWSAWPDFTQIPSPEHAKLRFQAVEEGKSVVVGDRLITPLPVNHTVPAVGYHLDSGAGSLVFSGDTTVTDELWEHVNKIANLRYLLIESAFSNCEKSLALLSKHLCPSLLAEELTKFRGEAEIFITHLKPGRIELTMREIEEGVGGFKPRVLQASHVFEI